MSAARRLVGSVHRLPPPRMDVSRTTLLLVCTLVLACGWPPQGRAAAAVLAQSDTAGHAANAAHRILAKTLGVPEGVSLHHRHDPAAPAPDFMLDLYHSVTDSSGLWRGDSPYGADTVRSTSGTARASDGSLQFAVEWPSDSEELREAELHVHLLPHVAPHGMQHVVRRVRVSLGATNRPLDSRPVPTAGGWAVFHVRSAVEEGAHRGPLVLRLEEETSDGRWRRANVTSSEHHEHHREPLLVLYGRDNSTADHRTLNEELVRHARSVSPGRFRRDTEYDLLPSGCERRSLYIDFRDIGWSSFIVAPSGYDAYHCLGGCQFPLTPDQHPTNHATVQSLIRQSLVGRAHSLLQPPSCVPSKLASVPMLIVTAQNQVVLKKYTDMVAEECGCH